MTLLVPGNPPIHHRGGTSVFHLVLRGEETEPLVSSIAEKGLRVELRKMSGQTGEQAEERALLVGQEERVWPSVKCPTCSWFDPIEKGFPCGLVAWPPESIKVLRERPQYETDEGECPVRETIIGICGQKAGG